MRVVLIGHTYILEANRGKLRELARGCERFAFIAPDLWPEKDLGPRRFQPSADLEGFAIPCTRAGHVRRYRFEAARLESAMADLKPEVVLVEAEAGSLVALQAARLARKCGAAFTQFCWENIPARFGLRTILMRMNFRKVDLLFCGSEGARETAHADGYRGKTVVVPQVGVDLAALDAAERRRVFPEEIFTVGVVARLDVKKGVDTAVKALADPAGGDARLVVIGDGPERENLQNLARGLFAEERVRFVGAVRHEEVAGYMKGFDAFVLPSRDRPEWREQFGHVLAEAMAVGTPVIGSDGGAIPEVVGDAGIIFRQDRADELASAIRKLRLDASMRKDLALKGRGRVEERFTDAKIAQALLTAFRSIERRP